MSYMNDSTDPFGVKYGNDDVVIEREFYLGEDGKIKVKTIRHGKWKGFRGDRWCGMNNCRYFSYWGDSPACNKRKRLLSEINTRCSKCHMKKEWGDIIEEYEKRMGYFWGDLMTGKRFISFEMFADSTRIVAQEETIGKIITDYSYL